VNFFDRLQARSRETGSVLCFGLDPEPDMVPVCIRGSAWFRMRLFLTALIRDNAARCACFKLQTACYEAMGVEGHRLLLTLVNIIHSQAALAILDGKRGDIGNTMRLHYQTAFEVFGADAMTVNPYMGRDVIDPLRSGPEHWREKGIFVLARTSNYDGAGWQDSLLHTPCLRIYENVADRAKAWAELEPQLAIGLVAGPESNSLRNMRNHWPEVTFLVPGIGAQGGSALALAPAFRPDGTGVIVNSSRELLRSFDPVHDTDWREKVQERVEDTNRRLANMTPASKLMKDQPCVTPPAT
jgi:orotidine 5'-phosphate decarboxylase subfamily 2